MALDKMLIAKAKLSMFAGFWSMLAAKLQWVPDSTVPTACTNGFTVRYNREWVESMTQGEVTYVAIHEIGHNMLAHMTRLQGREPKRANIAMDYVLNLLLERVKEETKLLGMETPKSALLDGQYKGMTWEAVYELLVKKYPLPKPGQKGQPGEGDGKGDGMPKQFDEVQKPGGGKDEDGEQDGSGGTMTDAEQAELQKTWTVAVEAAAQMARKQGKMPGYMDEFVRELITPKVNWRAQLYDACLRIAKDDVTYRRIERRHIHRGVYLPGRYSESLRALAYFCDTSGSISSNEFAAAKGAMTEILDDLKPQQIFFGQCDTRLHSVDELTPDDLPLPALKVHGRGGTDMKEAFQWACEHGDDIDAFILQTDLYVPPLDRRLIPDCKVIIIATTEAPAPAGWEGFNIVRVQV